jgi:hypothetical protein
VSGSHTHLLTYSLSPLLTFSLLPYLGWPQCAEIPTHFAQFAEVLAFAESREGFALRRSAQFAEVVSTLPQSFSMLPPQPAVSLKPKPAFFRGSGWSM